MEKHTRNLWRMFIVYLVIYIGIVVFTISANDKDVEKVMYHNWYQSYVVSRNEGSYVNTTSVEKPVALSESQGYGMVITVLAAQKGYATEKEFDQLFRYYQHYQLSDNSALMEWKQTFVDGKWSSVDANNATDGDLDIAYSLILASKQWPKNASVYEQAARRIIASIKAENYNQSTGLLTVGNWATLDQKSQYLFRPSDVMPVYFEEFARFTGDDFWIKLEQKSIDVLSDISKRTETGLIPDFAWVTEDGVTLADRKIIATADDGNYAYNSARIPMRLAKSEHLESQEVLTKMLQFFQKQPVIYGGYTLEGKPLNDYQSASFSAPILYAASENPNFSGLYAEQQWVYQYKIEGKDYYGDTLKLMVMLQL